MQAPVSPLTLTCVFSADTRTTGNLNPASVKRLMETMWRQGAEITHIKDASGAEFEMTGGALTFKSPAAPARQGLFQER